MKEKQEIKETKAWIKDFVLKHNLCPFAHKPVNENKVKYIFSEAPIGKALEEIFFSEIQFLTENPDVSNSFLVCPKLNHDFLSYIHFIYKLEDLLVQKFLENQFQLASFHPAYQFGGTTFEDVSNKTNRSPHALIHILRGDEMEQAIKNHGNTEEIPIHNIEKMEKLFSK